LKNKENELKNEQEEKRLLEEKLEGLQKVYKEGKTGKKILVAQGFEEEVELEYLDTEGQTKKWVER